MNEDWIRKINEMIESGEHKEILSTPVIEVKGKTLTEDELLREQLQHWSYISVKNRDIYVPNFASKAVQEMLVAIVADFKKQNGESRTVKPLYLATVDDIVVMPLRPEVFGLDNFYIANNSVGTISIIPQEGQAAGTAGIGEVTSDGYFKIDPKKARIVYTDFIENNPAGIITAIQGNIDKRNIFPYEVRNYSEISEVKTVPLPSIEIQRIQAQWKAKVEFAGDTEFIPYGVAITFGEYVPTLS